MSFNSLARISVAHPLFANFINDSQRTKMGDAYFLYAFFVLFVRMNCARQWHWIELNVAELTIKLNHRFSIPLTSRSFSSLFNVATDSALMRCFSLNFPAFFYCTHIENTFCYRHFYWYMYIYVCFLSSFFSLLFSLLCLFWLFSNAFSLSYTQATI